MPSLVKPAGIRVLVRQGTLGQDVQAFDLPPSTRITPGQVLEQCRDKLPRSVPIGVAVDGELVTGDALDVELVAGQQVVLLPRTSDVVAIIVTVLINIAVAAAVNYVASLLSPRPKAVGDGQERGDDSSQTFAWDGIKTNYGPGLPIPWGYGRHALGGQVIWTDVQASRSSSQAPVDDRLRLILSLCEGPIHRFGDLPAGNLDALGGFVGGSPGGQIPSDLRVNGTLIETSPLPGAMVWLRPGHQDQPPLPSPFAGVRQTFTVNAPMDKGSDFVFTYEGEVEISELGFVFSFPAGLYQQTSTGALAGLGASINILWRQQGASAWVPAPFLSIPIQPQAFVGLHVATHRVTITATGPIEIRVFRQAGIPGQQYVDQAVWRDVVVVSPHVLRYPGDALLALDLVAGARFSGGLPQISLRCDLLSVRVWDATHGWSPRCWDVPAAPYNFNTHPPGRNPGWCLLDFLLAEHGLGRYLTEDKVDLPAFRRWAAACDSDPNPAAPWGEPSHTIDVVGDKPRPVWEWVLLFCAAGRATPVMRNGKLSVVYQYRDEHGDAGITVPAKQPLQLLTSGNCENVKVSWLPKRRLATVLEFQFLNEERAYSQDLLPVEDPDSSHNDPTALHPEPLRVETIQAYGVTRPSQLWREGIWRHKVQRQVERELTGTTGPWALAAEVGDVFDFEHELLRPFAADVPLNMALVSVADTTHLTIDHHLAGSGLQIVVRDPDGKPVRSNISSFSNITEFGTGRKLSQLTLATAITVAAGATCVVGLIDKLTQQYQLVALTQAKDLKRDFRAVQWTPDAYDPPLQGDFLGEAGEDVGGERAVDEQDTDELPPSVVGIRVITELDGTHRVVWARPASKRGTWARVYMRPADLAGAWVQVGGTELDDVHVRGLQAGRSYVVAVCLANRSGDPVPPDLGDQLAFAPEEFPAHALPKITNARATLLGDGVLLEWNQLAQRELLDFEVRCGSNWPAAAVVTRVAAARAVIASPPAGPTFLVAARSRSGLFGGITAIANPGWTPRETVQMLDVNDLAPAGTHTDTAWNSTAGVIELAAGALRGTYESLAQDLTTQAPYYWQVAIDREEFEDLTVADLAGRQLGSGEARWRLTTGRPASPENPGLGWHLRCQDLAGVLCGDLPPDLLARGYRGVVGSHTRVLLESRFHVDGAWTSYQPHVDRVVVAQQIQLRLTFGRRALRYRARVRQLAYRAFI